MLPITDIRTRLAACRPKRFTPNSGTLQAAVAIILREREDDTEVLLIKRAEIEGDPWSGDMAFPGGHREPQDVDLAAAALRETEEEIGLVVRRANMIGALSQQRPTRRGGAFDMLVAPYVFFVDGDPCFDLSSEVAAAVWSPLGPMHGGPEPCHRESPDCRGADAVQRLPRHRRPLRMGTHLPNDRDPVRGHQPGLRPPRVAAASEPGAPGRP